MSTINMVNVRKESCVEKICNLPLDFKVGEKTSLILLQESKFTDFHNVITKQDIKDYLSLHENVIENWKIWSEDKRTLGYYLSIRYNKYFVGSIDKDGKENFSKYFTSIDDACAEFILREVRAILNIKMT
jgi:hypothetical protein